MITLVSDNAWLIPEFDNSGTHLRYRFYILGSELYSSWRILQTQSPELLLLVEEHYFAEAWHQTFSYSAKEIFFKMRRQEPVDLQLPPHEFEQMLFSHNSFVSAKEALSTALKELNGFGGYCEVQAEKVAFGSPKYVYRQGTVWSCRRDLTRDQWVILIDRANEAHREALVSLMDTRTPESREVSDTRFIAVEVRREVWRRDGGKCVQCQSQVRLEFDHVVPVSMGGSNTVRNIQLLCEACNRRKGPSLG